MRVSTLMLLPLLFATTGAAIAADVSLSLREVRAQTGEVRVSLVDEAGYGGKAKAIAATSVAPSGETLTLSFPGIAPGRYAVMVMHDENGNGKLDSNMLGMPTEGYGFSNNPRVMRRPTFAESAFEIGDAPVALDITLR